MRRLHVRYLEAMRHRAFSTFWLGFTLSALGDVMTQTALVWFVYSSTHSAKIVGLFLFAYTAPVVLGGLGAGYLLDRFNLQRVMTIDSLLRGTAVAALPVLYALGHLALWHVFGVAVLYGLLKMITMAGGPSLIPALLPKEHLATANALETLGFTITGTIGAPIAGLLIARFGAPNVLVLDAISYANFALVLFRVRLIPQSDPGKPKSHSHHLMDAVRLILTERILLLITILFMAGNLGAGAFLVWLPIFATHTLHGGPQLYGVLPGFEAAGAAASSLLVGGADPHRPLGALICGTQVLSGTSMLFVLFGGNVGWTACGIALFGFFGAPLTIWAQTLRMEIIPPELRGRTFALLRTLILGTLPAGGAAAGILLPIVGMPAMIGGTAALVAIPAVLTFGSRQIRSANVKRHVGPGLVAEHT